MYPPTHTVDGYTINLAHITYISDNGHVAFNIYPLYCTINPTSVSKLVEAWQNYLEFKPRN